MRNTGNLSGFVNDSKVRGWFGFVNNIPLAWKFVLIYLVGVLLPILTINLLFFHQMMNSIEAKEETYLQLTMDRTAIHVNQILLGAVDLSHSIATDRSLYETLDREHPVQASFHDSVADSLRIKIKPYLSAYLYVDRILLYNANPSLASGGFYFSLDEAVREEDWYRHAAASGHDITVFTEWSDSESGVKGPFLSIVRKLREYREYSKYDKFLKIDMKPSSIDAALLQERNYMTLRIVDGTGRRLFPTGDSSGDRGDNDYASETSEGLLERRLMSSYNLGDWRLVGEPNEGVFHAERQEAKRFIWLLAAASMLVPTGFIWVMLRSYNYRIKLLSRHMNKAQNRSFDNIELPPGKDEIGGLIRSFNGMASTIEALIRDVYKLEIEQKDMQIEQIRAELKLLQSQMNPHFLFNTLNALLVVSAKNGYTEVAGIIRDLSQLMRRMISWSDELVTLEDELQFTEKYLKIEKFRFSERFNYTIDAEEAALRCMVPKMCIQPLVENACKHGFSSRGGQRQIRIEAIERDNHLIMQVQDNGQGIAAERIAYIRAQMDSSFDTDKNIGLRNVYKRLKLYFEDNVYLFIDSIENHGATIGFRIPAQPRADETGWYKGIDKTEDGAYTESSSKSRGLGPKG